MPSFLMLDTLTRLRQRIENTDSINQDDLGTLLGLVGQLENEATELETENTEQVRQAIAATEAACNHSKDDEGPIESLQNAIQEIEASHPKTAETLARIGNILGRMGI
ncbi:MAG: DUF4404 family protein [Verrucomicrobiota bacterium]